ncbi:MAG: hypothetical protein KKA67_11370 [Spirochaetes bacterium]|nr:hypothetical protein [Spirochaetota bacterium]MBU1081169.1 hypothetical protein [Spirochaetota bacterium]
MKRIAISILAIITAAFVASPAAAADPDAAGKGKSTPSVAIRLSGKPADGPMGIGVFLGQPSGITFEMDLSPATWVDIKAAWDFSEGKGGYSLLLQGNFEYAFPGTLVVETESFTPFVGAGAIVNVYDGGASFGARVPAGVSYRFRNVPFELFIEAGLDIYLLPGFGIGGSGGLGGRYRF